MTTEPERSDDWRPSRISAAAQLLLMLGAAAAVFLAGGPHEANLGVYLVVAGLALVVCPPQARLTWKMWAVGAGLVLCASLALLPHDWFPNPEWRGRLIDAGVPLPRSITAAPEETCFWLAIFAIASSVALFALMHPVRSKTLVILASVMMAICAAYAGLALYAYRSGWEYPFAADPATFGFFHNRNHTATFLMTGCVAAPGVLLTAFRERHWLAGLMATMCLGVCLTGLIFFTTSRGGILSLLIGIALWLAGLGGAHRSRPLLISFAALFLGGLFLFLAPQSVVRHRMLVLIGLEQDAAKQTNATQTIPSEPSLDARLLIFSDAFGMVRDYPITGTGLGTFRQVFPQYRLRFVSDTPNVHPESDWLMLATETGVLTCLVLAVGLAWLISRVWRLRNHSYWPLRWGILCAALAAFLHGIVDVPAHRTALGWWLLAIFVLGFQAPPRDVRRPPRGLHLLFVLVGCGTVILGGYLIRAAWFNGRPAPFNASFEVQTDIIRLRAEGNLPASVEAARQAIARFPLAGWLHYQLGLTLLRLGGREEEADAAFHAQRLLNPNSPQVAIDQGTLWLPIDANRTLGLWVEAIRDRERMDQRLRRGEAGALALSGDLIGRAAEHPDLQRDLYIASAKNPAFALAGLERVRPPFAAAELSRLSANTVFIQSLTEPERRQFLQTWYARGDREPLFRFVEEHPDWESASWQIQLRRLLDAGKFEEAIRGAALYYKIDLNLPAPGASDAEVRSVDPANPIEAFDAAWKKGNTIAAKRILEEARVGQGSPEVWRLSAGLAASEGQWKSAWQFLDRYIGESHLEPPP
ncbi:MAG TPA: O-antigen ligase family protein [Chthoniobacteraceae bacterium]|nr:O-antigen ligase family protein [Chthoniobacteraceae bacterium]